MRDQSESGADDLRFDRAIPADEAGSSQAGPEVRCANCGRLITSTYHTVNGQPVCSACRAKLEAANGGSISFGTLVGAAIFGLGAALLGAIIYWAVMEFLNLEIGLVAILTGWMVGKAVRAGAGGRGARRLQVGAALLVYLSVAAAYVPFAIGSVMERAKADLAVDSTAVPDDSLRMLAARFDSLVAADSAARAQGLPGAVPDSAATVNAIPGAAEESILGLDSASSATALDSLSGGAIVGVLALGVLAAILFALALPIMAIFSSLPGGLISALIIGFGMVQAWQLTGRAKLDIEGPFRVGGSAPPAA